MADHTYVDPDDAKSASSKLRSSGERFKVAARRLTEATQQYDGCWGNDEFGQNFAKGYKPGADGMVKGAGSLGDGVSSTAEGADLAVEALVETDEFNAENL